MIETNDLINLKLLLSNAIKTSKKLDRCHESYLKRTKSGFSRAITTTYSANSSNLSTALSVELEALKSAAKLSLNL